MPLPLPHLDTRTWKDLTDEGRALIPVYAPEWTDHNASDPGITLMELFAFLTEQLIFRLNQVPARHRRKFLELVGYPPQPPQAARGVLSLSLLPAQPALNLPPGLTLAGRISLPGDQAVPGLFFRTLSDVNVSPAVIQAVQVFDGRAWADLTPAWREGAAFPAWGSDPAPAGQAEAQPALYIGFDQSLPAGQPIRLWLEFANSGSSQADARRLLEETAAAAQDCAPSSPGWPCPPQGEGSSPSTVNTAPAVLPPHYSVRTAWEFYDGAAWQALDGGLVDGTRSFSFSGPVQVTLPAAIGPAAFGAIPTPACYLRCRMLSGPPDAAPVLKSLFANAVEIEQKRAARHAFPIRAGVVPPVGQEPQVGQTGRIDLTLDEAGEITSLAFGPASSGPPVFVLDYQAAGAAQPGSLLVDLILAGLSTGFPQQSLELPFAPICGGSLQLWTLEGGQWQPWSQVSDFDASGLQSQVFTLDEASGALLFGDGAHGRVPPSGAAILAAYESTAGAGGNLPARLAWQLAGADDPLNQALLGAGFQAAVDALAPPANPVATLLGADSEDISHAAGRAATALYAHERLVELSQSLDLASLDQIDPARKLALVAPQRAATLLDYERLALDVPGTTVRRARAWAGLDPQYPCFQAPGTLAVVVLPELPAARPEPTPGLLAAVRSYLGRRKLAGTRLVVCGPDYLQVTVLATIQLVPGANAARVQAQVIQQLNTFLHPLRGGPDGLGWPFGRAVYRSEILQVIDNVPGVDHILSLELQPGQGEPQCDNLCLGPLGLVAAGQHVIRVA